MAAPSPIGAGRRPVGLRGVARTLPVAAALSIATPAASQQRPAPGDKPPIQDNSFLVEEAYNQERGVVQHISAFAHTVKSSAWGYTFTQEWPLRGQRHQLSYTIPVAHTDRASGGNLGLGDVMLNYRFQAAAAEGLGVAFAPRLTAILPTGASRRGLGAGGAGVQLNLPVSLSLPASLVLHSNAGLTYVPRARNSVGDAAAVVDYNVAQSVVWLARPRVNFLVEAAWSRTREVTARSRTEPSTEFVLSPGVRGAIDFPSGLQIVPGLAFPVGVGPSRGEQSVFVYLSFEHPFASVGTGGAGAPEGR